MINDIKLICRLNKDWRPRKIKVKKAGGQTNRNWIIEFQGKKFFVRLPWERTDIVNREVEAKNILALARSKKLIGILPKYYLYIFKRKNILSPKLKRIFDLPNGTMAVEYIGGKDIDGEDLGKPKNQEADQKTISKLIEKFEKSPLVYQLVKTSGRYNLLVGLLAPNLESIASFVDKEIRRDPGVKHIDISIGELPIIPEAWNPPIT